MGSLGLLPQKHTSFPSGFYGNPFSFTLSIPQQFPKVTITWVLVITQEASACGLDYMGLRRISYVLHPLCRKVRSLPLGGSRKCVLLWGRIKSRLEFFLKLPLKSRTTSNHPLVSPSSLEFSSCLWMWRGGGFQRKSLHFGGNVPIPSWFYSLVWLTHLLLFK